MSGIGMLSMEAQLSIENHLKDFLSKSESTWAAIVDKGGNLFAQHGETGNLDMSILCALAAGSFAATRELAKRLGEAEFTALYHEGAGISILMTALLHDTLLVTVFGENTNIGLVRFYAGQTSQILNLELQAAYERALDAGPLQIEADLPQENQSIIS